MTSKSEAERGLIFMISLLQKNGHLDEESATLARGFVRVLTERPSRKVTKKPATKRQPAKRKAT